MGQTNSNSNVKVPISELEALADTVVRMDRPVSQNTVYVVPETDEFEPSSSSHHACTDPCTRCKNELSIDEPSQEEDAEYWDPHSLPRKGSTASLHSNRSMESKSGRRRGSVSTKRKDFNWQRGNRIGKGAFGDVYLGVLVDTGELIVAKEVSLQTALPNTVHPSGKPMAQALCSEVSLLSTLSHEHIVRYYGASVKGSTLTIFLEYVSGGSLSQLRRQFGRFSESVLAVYMMQVVHGLAYLHARSIAHMDVKGDNILVDAQGRVKLADFGASRRLRRISASDGHRLDEVPLVGTVYFMSPELIKTQKVSRKGDIWSLGCTMIELVTGIPPWPSFHDNPLAAMYHIASIQSPPDIPPMSSKAVDFVRQCCTVDVDLRPTAEALLQHPFLTNV